MAQNIPTHPLTVALVGNPNAGKSSLFNCMTGLHQKVGNFPGVTVDKKTGQMPIGNEKKALVVDLPGAYSLYPTTLDERIVLEVFLNQHSGISPDKVIYVADATNLERHLLLLTQLRDLGLEVILALNMVDVAMEMGVHHDTKQLEVLLGLPVVEVNGRTGMGLRKLKELIAADLWEEKTSFYNIPAALQEVVSEIRAALELSNDYQALLMAHHFAQLKGVSEAKKKIVADICSKHQFQSIRHQVDETMSRYHKMGPVLEKVTHKEVIGEETFTDKVDRIVTHPVVGPFIFFLLLFLMFQAIFSWATYPMDWIDAGFGDLSGLAKAWLPESWFSDMISEGILPGIGGILIFIPQIAILFGFIAILEEIGYMARAVFLFDKLMQRFGLNGRSIVSLISGVACAIPAIMATRTIGNWKERLITIFVTPLMSCSARIPVYVVLVAFVVPEQYFLGVFNLQGLAVLGLYLLGASSAILSALAMKKLLKTSEYSYFVMELPVYKMPYWKNVGFTIVEKVKTFVWEAGKVILAISIVLWFMASYGPGESMEKAAEQVKMEAILQDWDEEEVANRIAARQIEYSYAGHFGRFIEPVIRPLGFDWKIGIALITSFAAREVFVGTMATIYSVGSSDDEATVREKMRNETRPDGRPVYDLPTSFSLLIYYVFAMQCMSTLAVVYRETKSWKWPILQALYMTGLAYVASLLVYQLFS